MEFVRGMLRPSGNLHSSPGLIPLLMIVYDIHVHFQRTDDIECQHSSNNLPYCVYRDGNGLFCIITIHKGYFSFNSKDIKVENM